MLKTYQFLNILPIQKTMRFAAHFHYRVELLHQQKVIHEIVTSTSLSTPQVKRLVHLNSLGTGAINQPFSAPLHPYLVTFVVCFRDIGVDDFSLIH